MFTFEGCNLGLDLIGQQVQPFEGKERDHDGWIVTMWNAGELLAIQRWKDEHTPWRHEEYIISSVLPVQQP